MSSRALTTTSFAILGLLAIRPWSAYELAQQMRRSLGYVWPRASSAIYEEPKNLVAHGLAASSDLPGERRIRAVYEITEPGRAALAAWLAADSAPPQFESEALVRISFPEAGGVPDLLRTLRGLAEHAAALEDQVREQARGYLDGKGGPFPGRLHVIALDARFVTDYAVALRNWAEWAQAQVGEWPATGPRPMPSPATMEVLSSVAGRDAPVRDAFPAELPRVAQVTLDAYSEFEPVLTPAQWSAYRTDLAAVRERLAAGAEIVVAVDAGRVVGSVAYFRPGRHEEPLLPPAWAAIRTLAVDPAHRRKGIGRRLLRESLARARRDRAANLGLFTAVEMRAAAALYLSEGFDDEGEREGPFGHRFRFFSIALD